MSFSAVTCHGCRVKELCTKRENSKGRILTLSPQPISEARSRRRTEQGTPAFQQRYALRAGIEDSVAQIGLDKWTSREPGEKLGGEAYHTHLRGD